MINQIFISVLSNVGSPREAWQGHSHFSLKKCCMKTVGFLGQNEVKWGFKIQYIFMIVVY